MPPNQPQDNQNPVTNTPPAVPPVVIQPQIQPNQITTPTPLTPEPSTVVQHNGLYSTDPQSVAVPQPLASSPTQIMSGSVANPITADGNGGRKKSKLLSKKGAASLLLASAIIAGAIGFLFFWYIPNQPNNVWNTGMSRTGKQIEAIINTLEDPENFEKLQKNKVTAQGTLTLADQSYTIGVESVFDDTNSDSNVEAKGTSEAQEGNFDITAAIKTQLPTEAIIPNIYFKLQGIDALGLDAYIPGINALDNQWVSVEQDVLKELETPELQNSGNANNITQDQYIAIMRDIQTVASEYIFTDDPEKAVIEQTSFIGTEESEGIKANHYTAHINKEHFKTFCEALVNKVATNTVLKEISGLNDADYSNAISNLTKECQGLADEIDANKSFDLWIDKKYKLIHKIRLYEDLEKAAQAIKAEKDECLKNTAELEGDFCSYIDRKIETGERYTEFGQIYKGNDTFIAFMNVIANTNFIKDSLAVSTTIDGNALKIAGVIVYSSDIGDAKSDLNITFSTEPYTGEINASKPEGSISITEALNMIGLDYLLSEGAY